MNTHRPTWRIALVCAAALIIAACGPSQAQSNTPDSAATQQAAVQQAVAATLTAQSSGTNATAATATPPTAAEATAGPPTDTPQPKVSPTEAVPGQTNNAAPVCSVQSGGLNMRAGPGVVFAPPIAALPAGSQLTPLAFVARGFPSGQWIQVQTASGQIGWVSALQTSISCNIDPTQLPPGVAPPTPAAATAAPAPTATQPALALIAESDVVVGGDLGDLEGKVVALGAVPGTYDPPVFHDKIALRAIIRDPQAGNKDGAGIDQVEFKIFQGQDTSNDSLVYSHIEKTAGFCSFGGGEPTCTILDLSKTTRWPTSNKPIQKGVYSVQITTQPKDPNRNGASWHFEFKIQ
jgi:hypothetical protein